MTFTSSWFIFVTGLLFAIVCPGGTKSRACTEYFDLSEQCAAKSPPHQAEVLRGVARMAREAFEETTDLPQFEENCKKMTALLREDPNCSE